MITLDNMKTEEERQAMYAQWAQERKEQRENRINEIKKELKEVVTQDTDFDTIIDMSIGIITNNNKKLTNTDIVEICHAYFEKNKTKEQFDNSNVLYENLDHANNYTNDLSFGAKLFYD